MAKQIATMDKLEALKHPHAYVTARADTGQSTGYAHVRAWITLDDDATYVRRGNIEVTSQIGHGTDFLDGIRRAMKNPNDRSYAHRLEYDSGSNGLRSENLKIIAGIVARFEAAEDRDATLASFMLTAFEAARIRYVFLEPDVRTGAWGIDKKDCEMVDLKTSTGVLRLAQWVCAKRDALWEQCTPMYLRERAAQEADAA